MSVIIPSSHRIQSSNSSAAFKRRLLCGTILAGLIAMPTGAKADALTMTALGTLGGTQSTAVAVTNDGIVVGDAYAAGSLKNPYSWTSAGGMINLGTFGGSRGDAKAISADGSVIVGYADLAGDTDYHAYRWTYAGGKVDLGTLGGTASYAKGVSADGSVVVGISTLASGRAHAFLWTAGGGMVDLGTLGGNNSYAECVSGDGAVVAGESQVGSNTYAFRWTLTDGMVNLGTFGGTYSVARGISYDGSVVVGNAAISGTGAQHPFRWTQAGGKVDLGTLGGTYGVAFGVSADGSIVVGSSRITGDTSLRAFRWTQAGGMKDLNTLLSDAGVNMTGINLYQADGISPNGKYIVGEGAFTGYTQEAFLVYYNESTTGAVVADVTTASQQQEATQNLATNQQAMLVESRSTASQLLGFSRPVDNKTYTYTGGMFGSAVGYVGGQISQEDATLLGGIAYGSQDYTNIKQSDAPTVALAGRYTFDGLFSDTKELSPYVELGGWVTPRADITMKRRYGTASSFGVGTTAATSYAGYARTGLVWDIDESNKLTTYGELGQQYMSFAAYSESASSSNPFPAYVKEGLTRMDIARAGGALTHKLNVLEAPVALTFSGAAAQAFAGQTGLTVNAGVGASTAAFRSSTWGEFGASAETELTENVGLNLSVNGTTGGTGIGTAVHGGAGMTFKF